MLDKISLRRQTNAFAMQYGMIYGLYWCLSFLFLVSTQPSLQSLGTILFISTPFVGFYLARRFSATVRSDGPVTYGRCYIFSLLTYCYATAILAITSYCYFRFIDHGHFIAYNLEILDRPDVKQLFASPDVRNQMGGLKIDDLKTALQSLTPISITASVINMSILAGLFLSIPTALFGTLDKRYKR